MRAIVSGAIAGAAVGGVLTWAVQSMQARKESAKNLGAETVYLQRDMQLAELISRFRPLSKHSREMEELYLAMVVACDEVVKHHAEKAAGQAGKTVEIMANRQVSAAVKKAKALCKQGFQRYNDPLAPVLTIEIENVEGLLHNHLYNIML